MILTGFSRCSQFSECLSSTKEYYILSSPSFMESNYPDENEPMQKALKYLLRNFHKKVLIKDLLEITNMSGSSFCTAFKNTYRMTFKDYLLSIRIGYACKLLTDSSQNISRAAYDSGFENISNFNRQFKKDKTYYTFTIYKRGQFH